ncbi:MAG: thiolase domain-containing protein [Aigarchaeota archaeon]|nr:thiolase domain-containing protein [Aigarchaeota archaeon]MDW8092500.1 thiolase domain-containing protein [Nitrososphaerota archaeon]
MTRAFIVAASSVKVEEHWDKSLEYLMVSAGIDAMRTAKVSVVDSIYVSNVCGELLQYQANLGPIVAEGLGLSGVPAFRVESENASGALAVRQAYMEIASGISDVVLVVGGEKLSDSSPDEFYNLCSLAERFDYVGYQGITPHAEAALLYKLYTSRYGAPHEDVAYFSVIMHDHAHTAPHSQYPFKVSLETVLNSPVVADPLRRLECTSPADGASAIILVSERVARRLNDPIMVELSACEVSTDYVNPFDREDPLWFSALSTATDNALRRSGVGRQDIDLIEVFDSFSIVAAISLESSGFAYKGKAGAQARSGDFALNGKLPINTFGGLKGRGHPFGATGVYQVSEAYMQLAEIAGKNQVDGARVAMTQTLAGLGSLAVVTVLKRV